jgi:Protein of unknown function (DUF4065)
VAADFIAYLTTGSSITGEEYEKWPLGPVPRRVVPTLKAMQAQDALVIAHREHFGRTQERPVALREPNLALFSGKEIAIVEEVIRSFWGRSAKEVSELSHGFIGWQATPDYQVIPYETALVDCEEPTEDAIAYAQELVRAGR